LHGSTDRSSKAGYKVVRLVMNNGRPERSEDFITGWLVGETVTGRPVGIVTAPTAHFTCLTTTRALSIGLPLSDHASLGFP
jgi:glucose/arabinose dehydrogenase